MTANRRIVLNIVATYGRSLYAVVIGLFCGRWTLMALGEVDYGLLGLVGGLTCFVSFLNGLLASAVGRFYAVNVGAAARDGNWAAGLEECRKWFNTAISVHWVLPSILMVIGYPVGEWAVTSFLTIPPDRVDACLWVWRFTCVSCFVGMLNVPFQAMYTAKQEIAELTIYSFATTTLNVVFLYYIVSHPNKWLVQYAAWTCALSVVPQIIISIRAMIKYPECRFVRAYLWNRSCIIDLAKYAVSSFLADFAGLFEGQIKSIVINKYMGPRMNASTAVGNVVASHALTLSGALSGAMWPAVANKAGEGNLDAVRKMVFVVCRTGEALIMVCAVPLFIEAHEVLRLWLVNPPPYAAEICMAVLLSSWLNKLTEGYWMAFCSLRIRFTQYCNRICLCGFSALAITWILSALGFGAWGICIATVCSGLLAAIIRLTCGRRYIGYSVRYWLRHVFMPASLCGAVAMVFGAVPRFLIAPSLVRVLITSVTCEVVMVPAIWLFLLEGEERKYLVARLSSKFPLVGRIIGWLPGGIRSHR